MQQGSTIRAARRVGLAFGCSLLGVSLLASLCPPIHAQVSATGEKQMGDPADDHLPNILNRVTIAQKLDQPLPLGTHFVDETGKPVMLGDYFGKRPAILALVYYNCPILCSEELKGLTGALEMVNFTPGKDFDVIVVSIDPTEKPALAASQKARYLKYYGRTDTANGWHFLTGQKADIDAVADATGFGYVKMPGPDGKMNQFAHASSIEIVTPDGKLAQYYLGVEYSPKDLRLGLIEASDHKIGTPVDSILTYCYHYDPQQNKHSLVVARVVQLGGVITVMGLGGFMAAMFSNDRKKARLGPPPNWRDQSPRI
jgi:protein SCO1/2